MKVTRTAIPEVLMLEPRLFTDPRGWFMESYNRREFSRATGIDTDFVQDNHSCSARNVLRGLHYQLRQPQGKLVRVVAGTIWDVAVDLRRSSPSFAAWVGCELSASAPRMIWIPPGFAHGFLVVSESAEVQYKTTDYYAPEDERAVRWSDPDLNIGWPLVGDPLVADKDRRAPHLANADVYA
jgi:dTDP-4-dehydrorhamnose 3,5-epimerase